MFSRVNPKVLTGQRKAGEGGRILSTVLDRAPDQCIDDVVGSITPVKFSARASAESLLPVVDYVINRYRIQSKFVRDLAFHASVES